MNRIDTRYTEKHYDFKYYCGRIYLAGHGVAKYTLKKDPTKIRLVHTTVGVTALNHVDINEAEYENIVDEKYENISDNAIFLQYLLAHYFNC